MVFVIALVVTRVVVWVWLVPPSIRVDLPCAATDDVYFHVFSGTRTTPWMPVIYFCVLCNTGWRVLLGADGIIHQRFCLFLREREGFMFGCVAFFRWLYLAPWVLDPFYCSCRFVWGRSWALR